jgi:hypothetical protein
MTTTSETPEFDIGDAVLLTGRIVGRSEFRTGPRAYYVEFLHKGKPDREWFFAADLEPDEGGEDE